MKKSKKRMAAAPSAFYDEPVDDADLHFARRSSKPKRPRVRYYEEKEVVDDDDVEVLDSEVSDTVVELDDDEAEAIAKLARRKRATQPAAPSRRYKKKGLHQRPRKTALATAATPPSVAHTCMVSLVRLAKKAVNRGKSRRWAPMDKDGDGIAGRRRELSCRPSRFPSMSTRSTMRCGAKSKASWRKRPRFTRTSSPSTSRWSRCCQLATARRA